jgi:Terminase large subunit, T4likevirus-type, N-terminal
MSKFADHLRGAASPVRFARQLGMVPDAWQERAMRSDSDRLLLCVGRQCGKSTTAAVMVLHRAIYHPGSMALIVAPSERQSQELFRKVLAFYRSLGRPIEPEAENRLSLELENGSRVVCLPGKESNIRGYSAVDLLVIDEASRVPGDLWGSVSPMLGVSRGRAIAISTPNGKKGWWWEASQSAAWEVIRVPSTECPRISAEWLEAERERVPDFYFRQEYLVEFLDPSGQFFSSEDIARIFSDTDESVEPMVSPEPPATASREPEVVRQRRQRQRANQRRAERRQQLCSHFWGPPVGDDRFCTHCDLKHPA